MTQPTPKRDWLPYAGFVLAVGGIVYQGGQLTAQVHDNRDRIIQLETRNRENNAKLEEMNNRGERSATKLDFLVQRAQDQDRSHK